MTPILFTRHAAQRIAERSIPLAWVEMAIRDPERVEPDPLDAAVERRFREVPEAEGRVLRVAVAETPDAIRVISVHFDRGATRRHARQHLRP